MHVNYSYILYTSMTIWLAMYVYICDADLRKPSLWAHFTHCSSFEHNYLIIQPILNFIVLMN